ncbi:MAG: hypothetical protein ABIY46_10525 [Gemmatimonadales bacterium]
MSHHVAVTALLAGCVVGRLRRWPAVGSLNAPTLDARITYQFAKLRQRWLVLCRHHCQHRAEGRSIRPRRRPSEER